MNLMISYSNRPKLLNFASSGMQVRMNYNPAGYRFKQLFARGGDTSGFYYLYSFNGQLISTYERSNDTLRLAYQPIYEGTKRIGIVDGYRPWWLKPHSGGFTPIDGVKDGDVSIFPLPPEVYESLLEHLIGDLDVGINTGGLGGSGVINVSEKFEQFKSDRRYELVDHLGNVRVVIANQRMPVDSNGDGSVDYYKPRVVSIHDYYPFGWEKTLTQDPYPFTYQGQLFDRELGWQYYRYRNYDPLVGRFWEVEPLIDSFPQWSGYVFSQNCIISHGESEGLESMLRIITTTGGALYVNFRKPGSLGEGILTLHLNAHKGEVKMLYTRPIEVGPGAKNRGGPLTRSVRLREIDVSILRAAYMITIPKYNKGLTTWKEFGMIASLSERREIGGALEVVGEVTGWLSTVAHIGGAYFPPLLVAGSILGGISTGADVLSRYLLDEEIDWMSIGLGMAGFGMGGVIGRLGGRLGRFTKSDFIENYVKSRGNFILDIIGKVINTRRKEARSRKEVNAKNGESKDADIQ